MEQFTINGHDVTYDDITHTYYVDGSEVISISTICKLDNPNLYRGIDEKTLNKAAVKGSNLHAEIETYEKDHIKGTSIEFTNYLKVKETLGFEVALSEKIVVIELDGQVLCAGRLDMVSKMDQDYYVMDFKRTYEIQFKYVTLQLNLYKIGLEQSYGITPKGLKIIRLRNHEVNVFEIPIETESTLETLKRIVNKQKK